MSAESAIDLLRQYGPLSLVALMALNRLGLVPGGMLILVTTGTLAHQGVVTPTVALVAAYVGTMVGDTALYGAGRYGLGWITRRQRFDGRRGRAQAALARWGVPAIFFTRWLVLPLTIAVSLICGLNSFRYRPFLLASALGNVLFVLLFIGIGYRFTQRWQLMLAWSAEQLSQISGLAVLVLLAGVLLAVLVFRAARRRAASRVALPPARTE